ncbi:MAG: putative taurine transport system permease protein [Rhodospirillales bacterium]|nr:putative taurine transport system permease protein [Rhodospirillales bacterium]
MDLDERARRWERRRDRLINVASPLGLVLAWEVAAQLGLIDTRFFPAPSSVAVALLASVHSGELANHVLMSLQRLFIGFVLGGVPALALGIVMGISRPVRAFIDPLIAATYPIPKSSIMPLILLVFGLGEGSKIIMVAIGVFYPVAINATAGVLQINCIYLDVGKSFNAGRWDTFRTIALPGALPFIMTGVKLGVGLGLVLIAVAEMVGAKSGIGYMIWSAWETFSVERMYVGLFAIAMIGFALTAALNEIERRIIPWKADS